MKLIADALIPLPFALDFCATGPTVEPLTCHLDAMDATLFFPPSLSDGTDGQGVFGDWAWWKGKTLRLVMEQTLTDLPDVEASRTRALAAGNEILRRFLNAYRWRFARPDVHPVTMDTRALSLFVTHDDGRKEALPEPAHAFFYQRLPDKPPLETSLNAATLDILQSDVRMGMNPPLSTQLQMDADLLDVQGEPERARLIRALSTGE